VRTLIAHILDISVLKWEDWESQYLKKLKATLDKEFEYVHNEFKH
jgi:hypothetical protein